MHGRRYPLDAMVTIAICAVICGVEIVRSRGNIENQLHRRLDEAFNEHHSRLVKAHSAQN